MRSPAKSAFGTVDAVRKTAAVEVPCRFITLFHYRREEIMNPATS